MGEVGGVCFHVAAAADAAAAAVKIWRLTDRKTNIPWGHRAGLVNDPGVFNRQSDYRSAAAAGEDLVWAAAAQFVHVCV